jgi:CheY-like chemotaxis protein
MRTQVRSILHRRPSLQVVGEASDGLDAVQKARDLQPDLILMDVGLPFLNGIEAARRIRELSQKSKILFLSEMRSPHFAAEALQLGGSGYIVKTDAASELLRGVDAVLGGGQFLSSSLVAQDAPEPLGAHSARDHEVGFYSDDSRLVEHVSRFAAKNLDAGNAVIVLATEPHRNGLCRKLAGMGLDMGVATGQGRYIAIDADEALSRFMIGGMLDPDRFENALEGLIAQAKEASGGVWRRVGVYGECVHLLCEQGNPEAAIDLEIYWNQLIEKYNVHLLCGYCLNGLHDVMNSEDFQRVRDEHSLVHFH